MPNSEFQNDQIDAICRQFNMDNRQRDAFHGHLHDIGKVRDGRTIDMSYQELVRIAEDFMAEYRRGGHW